MPGSTKENPMGVTGYPTVLPNSQQIAASSVLKGSLGGLGKSDTATGRETSANTPTGTKPNKAPYETPIVKPSQQAASNPGTKPNKAPYETPIVKPSQQAARTTGTTPSNLQNTMVADSGGSTPGLKYTPPGSSGDYTPYSGGGTQPQTAPAAPAATAIDQLATTLNSYQQGIDDYEQKATAIIDKLANLSSEEIAAYAQRTGQSIDAATKQLNDIISTLRNTTNQQLNSYEKSSGQLIGDTSKQLSDIIAQLTGTTNQQLNSYEKSSGQLIGGANQQISDILAALQDALGPANAGRVGRVNTTEQENLLAQIVAAQQEQSRLNNDYAVQKGVDQLTRAMEDAAPQYQTMRNQIAADEARALDNQALYAEARGDRGGIGAAQYASIQNTAAQNQLTVNREQTKLATDTARQIADLRAQGEFKKADELLSITQSYLSELMQLKQWADQTNVSIDEFNIGVQQWEQEYNAKIQEALAGLKIDATKYATDLGLNNQRDLLSQRLAAAQDAANRNTDLTRWAAEANLNNQRDLLSQRLNAAQNEAGMKTDATRWGAETDLNNQNDILSRTLSAAQNEASQRLGVAGNVADMNMSAISATESKAAKAAEQMIAAGITPTNQQLDALGWTREQYNAYKSATEKAAAASAGGGGSTTLSDLVTELMAGNVKADVIRTFITNNAMKYGADQVKSANSTLNQGIKTYGYKGEKDYDYGG